MNTLKTAGIALALLLGACSGGGGGGNSNPPVGFNGNCEPGTAVSLANPTPNSSGVPTNIGSITIVASGNNNTLYSSYKSWGLVLVDNVGNTIYSNSTLNLTSDPTGPHPYASDYYYQAGIPGLQPGDQYNVMLSTSSCNGVSIGFFST